MFLYKLKAQDTSYLILNCINITFVYLSYLYSLGVLKLLLIIFIEIIRLIPTLRIFFPVFYYFSNKLIYVGNKLQLNYKTSGKNILIKKQFQRTFLVHFFIRR